MNVLPVVLAWYAPAPHGCYYYQSKNMVDAMRLLADRYGTAVLVERDDLPAVLVCTKGEIRNADPG